MNNPDGNNTEPITTVAMQPLSTLGMGLSLFVVGCSVGAARPMSHTAMTGLMMASHVLMFGTEFARPVFLPRHSSATGLALMLTLDAALLL